MASSAPAGSSSRGPATDNAPPAQTPAKKGVWKAKMRTYWAKIGLDWLTFQMMIKGALPPTISLAIYQSSSVPPIYTTVGYLISIASMIGMALLPRAKFIQAMIMAVLCICVACSANLLGAYCAVKARQHTEPQVGYNASASAVATLWLFFLLFLINALKARFDQLRFASMAFSLYTSVSMTYATQFENMAAARTYNRKLLEGFMTGFAIATGVSLFVFPISVRTIWLKQATGFLGLSRGLLKAEGKYIHSLGSKDMYGKGAPRDESPESDAEHKHIEHESEVDPKQRPEAQALRGLVTGLAGLFGKMSADLEFAKREAAFGKLDAKDFQDILQHLRAILIPSIGFTSVIDIFDKVAEGRGWKSTSVQDPSGGFSAQIEGHLDTKNNSRNEWHQFMKSFREPFQTMTQAMDGGLEHAMITLELLPKPKKAHGNGQANEDVEAKGGVLEPGDRNYYGFLQRQADEYFIERERRLKKWCAENHVQVSSTFFKDPFQGLPKTADLDELARQSRHQRQLFVILYIEYLIHAKNEAVLGLVRFADGKVADGTMSKRRILLPTLKRLKKWVLTALSNEDNSVDQPDIDPLEVAAQDIYVGDAMKRRKDPEHLPPTNFREKVGEAIRWIPRVLRSQEAAFGLRTACACITVGVIGALHQSQHFYIEQRIFWAMIMIAIAMTPTSGASLFGFFTRVSGTLVAAIMSYVIWYIVAGKTGGIITMLGFFTAIEYYFWIKYPRFVMILIIGVVTQILIVGYELQVRKIGEQLAQTNQQKYYPVYLLSPYRLAVVLGGMGVAFFWTIFPFPMTDRSQLRKGLGASLYLLANYYSCVHETVRLRLAGVDGDCNNRKSPAHRLSKVRQKVFSKQMLLIGGLREHFSFVRYELSVGGKFPKERYNNLVNAAQSLLHYMALISYSSGTFSRAHHSQDREWIQAFGQIMRDVNVTSHEITSMLFLLSSAVTNGQPLPPYLQRPTPYRLASEIMEADHSILGVEHIGQPGYSAFVVMQVATSLMNMKLEELLREVRLLVGEIDFSFNMHGTSSNSTSATTSTAASTAPPSAMGSATRLATRTRSRESSDSSTDGSVTQYDHYTGNQPVELDAEGDRERVRQNARYQD
ncbi:hypothetical protein L228DRAFT_258315 [Xylona heveae TC161]|uniref:ER transporter 6TM N-terminal domain-containing protein n=1 Tax=Xylona heveae (strain CBS 132557 / TC161) TaxID=1328760 RepID=A0A165K472_XYLHT|nr:hypothetical protein L228DRAFT_258315 [Xylona heveae TC161]KZF26963.1 hypothetical protein L228DRAFT_258315 [Xylona heveae TC161]